MGSGDVDGRGWRGRGCQGVDGVGAGGGEGDDFVTEGQILAVDCISFGSGHGVKCWTTPTQL